MRALLVYLLGLCVVTAVVVAVLFVMGIGGVPVISEAQAAARARAFVEDNYEGSVNHVTSRWVPMGNEIDRGCSWRQIVVETFVRPMRPWERCGFYRAHWSVQVSGDLSEDGHPDIDFVFVELSPEGTFISAWWIDQMVGSVPANQLRLREQPAGVIPRAQ